MLHCISGCVSGGRKIVCYMVYLTVGGERRTACYMVYLTVSDGWKTECHMVYLTVLVMGGGQHATWYI